MHRRRLFQLGLSALGAGLLPVADANARTQDDIIGALLEGKPLPAPVVPAAPPVIATTPLVEPKWVNLRNVHTGEKLEAVYWEKGEYVPDAVQALNKVLRDYRNDESHPMDTGLYDILHQIHVKTEAKTPFQVISGYRSPATNKMLAARSGEVAKHSLHMDGPAMDVFLDDVDLKHVQAAALSVGKGGVGYYPVSKFVHVDVGRVRKWSGT